MNIIRETNKVEGKDYSDYVVTNASGSRVLSLGPLALKDNSVTSIDEVKEMINNTLAHLGIEYDESSIIVKKAYDLSNYPINLMKLRVDSMDMVDAFNMEWRFRYPDSFCRNCIRVGNDYVMWGYLY